MAKTKELSAEQALDLAEKAAANGNKEKAMKYYEAVLIKYPDHEEAMTGVRRLYPNTLLRADVDELEILMKNGQFREAEVRAKMYLELYPEVYDLCKILGGALVAQRHFEEAIDHLIKALDLMPYCVESHFNLANCYHATGKAKEAIRSYLKAIELKDDMVPAYNGLGNLFMELRDYEGAYDAFKQALDRVPNSPALIWSVGRSLMGKAEYGEAIKYLKQATDLDDTQVEMYLDLAMSHNLFGEINKARKIYEELASGPSHPFVHFHYGRFLEEVDELDNAIDQFQKAVDVAPDFLPVYQRLSDACKKSGDEVRAKEVLEKAEIMREFMESKASEHQVQ